MLHLLSSSQLPLHIYLFNINIKKGTLSADITCAAMRFKWDSDRTLCFFSVWFKLNAHHHPHHRSPAFKKHTIAIEGVARKSIICYRSGLTRAALKTHHLVVVVDDVPSPPHGALVGMTPSQYRAQQTAHLRHSHESEFSLCNCCYDTANSDQRRLFGKYV